MAALTTEFLARYSDARVRALTLPDNQVASSYDATKLAQAATDATEEFETLCGVTLDTSDVNHVRVAVLLMEALLLEWGSGGAAMGKEVRARAEAVADRVAKVTGRNRIMPDSNSGLTVTRDRSGQRPAFDPRYTEAVRLNPPGGGVLDRPDV